MNKNLADRLNKFIDDCNARIDAIESQVKSKEFVYQETIRELKQELKNANAEINARKDCRTIPITVVESKRKIEAL